MIQIMLLPHPPHPDAGASHPHPQFVAAKSLMLIPPELSLHFQYMHHGMSDFHSEDEKCCSSFPAEAVAEGKMPQEVRDQQIGAIIPYYKSFSKQEMNDVVKIDSSLAAMQLMLVARAHGYETNPIGGFEKDQLAEAFDLDKERFVPVMILSIGKAVEEGYESVRMNADKITTFK